MDVISKQEQKNICNLVSERKRKLESTTPEKKKVCVENYSWWTNMMLGITQGEHSQVSAVNVRKLKWDKS
jgi:hypothetical protein